MPVTTLRPPACALRVPIFKVLPPEVLRELGRAMRHRHYDRGEVVAGSGDPVSQLVVVASGRLKVVHTTPSGREQVVRTLGPGEFLGELALFAPARHEGHLIAQEPTDVCLVSRQAVQAILHRYPDVGVRLVEVLAERLVNAERRIADLGLRDVGQRLAAELLRASAAGAPGPDGVRLRMPVPWSEVAVQLATTPESLSRRLRALAAAGVIRQESARTLVILAPERLRELAAG